MTDLYSTPNEAVGGIEEGVKTERFKHCRNLAYATVRDRLLDKNFFVIMCRKECFINLNADKYPMAQMDGCPAHCRFFDFLPDKILREEAQQKIEDKRARWASVRKGISGVITAPFVWFKELSGLAQCLILLVVIIYFAPRIAQAIAEIIKALK